MTNIALTIQAGQIAYERATRITKNPSEWRSNIESKIIKWKSLIEILEKSKKLIKIPNEEKRKARSFMTSERLKFGNSQDAIEAISKLNDNILIFQKKIDMHEKRKAFTRANKSFDCIEEDSTKT